ncbi:hypothetical protein [Streptomyces sp. HPF1205]|uniref:hypothetical protein n=1 Tax=Streptomyces sp. HPF1205 TaxID=2873262 RepID=UPI001CEC566B|nr:hypothetical protein [Streptomyces sp. HPF1205]
MVLASTGGGAVVQAAGTDAWQSFRNGVARLVGRGEAERERRELERLDRTLAELEAAGDDQEGERVRLTHAAAWQTRFESLLEEAAEHDRERIAASLEALVSAVNGAAGDRHVHNDFRHSTFHGPVQGSGTQNNHYHQR